MRRLWSSLFLVCASFLMNACEPMMPDDINGEEIKTDLIADKVKNIDKKSKEAKRAIGKIRQGLNEENLNLMKLEANLEIASLALDEQQKELTEAYIAISNLEHVAAVNERKYKDLRKTSYEWQKRAEKFERKYLLLTKYRWAVISICGLGALIIIAKVKGIFL